MMRGEIMLRGDGREVLEPCWWSRTAGELARLASLRLHALRDVVRTRYGQLGAARSGSLRRVGGAGVLDRSLHQRAKSFVHRPSSFRTQSVPCCTPLGGRADAGARMELSGSVGTRG
jgi:hypothetical protein